MLIFSWVNYLGKANLNFRHPAPVVNYEVSHLCFGDTTYFTNTTVLASTYIWTIYENTPTDSSVIYTSTDFNIKFLFPHKGSFKVELDGDNGHFITLIRTLYVDTFVHSYFDYEYCSSQFVNLSTCYHSSFWDFGDGHTSTATSPVHYYDTTGLYHVKLTSTNGNQANSLTQSTQVVSVNNLTGKFTYQITKDSVLFIAADTLNQAPSTQYHWAFGDGATANLSHLTKGYRTYHSYAKKDTTYLVFLLVKTTCLNAFTQANLFVPDSTPVTQTAIYPNPSSSNLIHIISEKKNELSKIEILDYLSKPLNNFSAIEKTRGYDLDLFSFPTGVYFIRLYFGSEIITKKVVKTN